MIKAILYDLDGTLVDSIEDLGDALNAFLVRLGQKPADIHTFRSLLETGSRRLLLDSVEFLPEGYTPEELYMMFNDEYSTRLWEKSKPFPGVYGLLEKVKKRGLQQAVISNKKHDLVELVCDHFFKDTFEVCLGTMPNPPKPDPTMLHMVIDQLGIEPSEILYVGDTLGDMEAAKNAGVQGVWADWGYGGKHTFEPMLHQPMELMELLESLS